MIKSRGKSFASNPSTKSQFCLKKPWQENSSEIKSSKEEKEEPDETTALPLFPPAKIQNQREHVDENNDTDLDEEETKWIARKVDPPGDQEQCDVFEIG